MLPADESCAEAITIRDPEGEAGRAADGVGDEEDAGGLTEVFAPVAGFGMGRLAVNVLGLLAGVVAPGGFETGRLAVPVPGFWTGVVVLEARCAEGVTQAETPLP